MENKQEEPNTNITANIKSEPSNDVSYIAIQRLKPAQNQMETEQDVMAANIKSEPNNVFYFKSHSADDCESPEINFHPAFINVKQEIEEYQDNIATKQEIFYLKTEFIPAAVNTLNVRSTIPNQPPPVCDIQVEDRPFKCNVCGFITDKKGILYNHMGVHSVEVTFGCDQCDFRAPKREILYKHISIHVKVSTFQCNLCDFKTKKKTVLRKHIGSHKRTNLGKCGKGVSTHVGR